MSSFEVSRLRVVSFLGGAFNQEALDSLFAVLLLGMKDEAQPYLAPPKVCRLALANRTFSFRGCHELMMRAYRLSSMKQGRYA